MKYDMTAANTAFLHSHMLYSLNTHMYCSSTGTRYR